MGVNPVFVLSLSSQSELFEVLENSLFIENIIMVKADLDFRRTQKF